MSFQGSSMVFSRRDVMQLCAGIAVSVAFGLRQWRSRISFLRSEKEKKWLRPPGAVAEAELLARCIRCNQCAEVCENDCIQFPSGSAADGTPVIRPREKACILCMKCNHACPTGALQPIASDPLIIQEKVHMGTAHVDKNICNSYNGGVCGVCVRACPFTGEALKAGMWERPIVDESKCVGCGLCESSCIVYPQAIRVTPATSADREKRA